MIVFFLKDHALAFYHSLVEEVKEDMTSLSKELINRFNGSDGLGAERKDGMDCSNKIIPLKNTKKGIREE